MMRLVVVFLLQLFVADMVAASESAYVPVRRFMPLPPVKSGVNVQPVGRKPPAKFFPLAQATRPPMPLNHNENNMLENDVAPKNPAGGNNNSGKKVNMSEEDAKQIISIFTATK